MLGAITSEAHDSRLADKDESTGQKKDVRARRLGYAHALLEKREFEPALTVLRALHAEEETPAVALLIGATLLDLGRTEDAGKVLDPMLEQDVTSPRAMVTLARLEFARGKPTKAETLLQAALVHSPEKGQILFLMGQIYEDRADLVKAVDCYRRALEESYGLPRSPTSKASHNLGSDPAAGTSPGEKPGG
jgi:predicted Zn-dependent protease